MYIHLLFIYVYVYLNIHIDNQQQSQNQQQGHRMHYNYQNLNYSSYIYICIHIIDIYTLLIKTSLLYRLSTTRQPKPTTRISNAQQLSKSKYATRTRARTTE